METIQIVHESGKVFDVIVEERLDNGDMIVRYGNQTMTLKKQPEQVGN